MRRKKKPTLDTIVAVGDTVSKFTNVNIKSKIKEEAKIMMPKVRDVRDSLVKSSMMSKNGLVSQSL